MSLVLTQKLEEKIHMDGPCTITLIEIGTRGKQIRLAFDAPKTTRIVRNKILDGCVGGPKDRDGNR